MLCCRDASKPQTLSDCSPLPLRPIVPPRRRPTLAPSVTHSALGRRAPRFAAASWIHPPLHICVLASAPAIEGFGRHHLSQAPSTSNPRHHQIAIRIVGDAGRHACFIRFINIGTLRTLTGRCRSGLAPARSHGRRPSLPACIPGAWSGVIAAPELGLHFQTPRQSRVSWALHIPGDVANLHAPCPSAIISDIVLPIPYQTSAI